MSSKRRDSPSRRSHSPRRSGSRSPSRRRYSSIPYDDRRSSSSAYGDKASRHLSKRSYENFDASDYSSPENRDRSPKRSKYHHSSSEYHGKSYRDAYRDYSPPRDSRRDYRMHHYPGFYPPMYPPGAAFSREDFYDYDAYRRPNYYPYDSHYHHPPATTTTAPSGHSDAYTDIHGHKAASKLFLDKLPPDTKEEDVKKLFEKFASELVEINLGKKALAPGEFRTCIVSLANTEVAVKAREALHNYKEESWTTPLIVNFAREKYSRGGHHSQYHGHGSYDYPHPGAYYPDPRYSYGYPPSRAYSPPRSSSSSSSSSFSRSHGSKSHVPPEYANERDKLGNPAINTLFIVNFDPSMTYEDAKNLFPTAKKISMGKKELKPGDFRTAYITFEDVGVAVKERTRMLDFVNEKQKEPLKINFSRRSERESGYSSGSSRSHYSETDARGNPASNGLFFEGLPLEVTEEELRALFDPAKVKFVQFGTKPTHQDLKTCVVKFITVEDAIEGRNIASERLSKYQSVRVLFYKNKVKPLYSSHGEGYSHYPK